MIMNILIGLLGLGLVVMIHEYGHLIAARIVGVDVAVFSIGWGPKLWAYRRRNIEYRISLLPIGGYVRLKGEEALTAAHSSQQKSIAHIPNGYFSVAAWKRIIIAAGGPLFNILAALVIFSTLFTIGYTITTYENRIVLVSDFDGNRYAADEAGLQTGDRIIAINGTETEYFFQIREQIVAQSAPDIEMVVQRGTEMRTLRARGMRDPASGVSVLGVYPWIEPTIAAVTSGSTADVAGLMAGDVITAVDDESITHGTQLSQHIRSNSSITMTVLRGATVAEFRVPIGTDSAGNPDIGITFPTHTVQSARLPIVPAIGRSLQEIGRIFRLTIQGIGAIFSGTRVTQVIAGPIQLTSIIGDVARSGGEQGFWAAARALVNFLAIINIALCFMNILPIPILDGGQMLLYAWETVRGKALRPSTIVRYQQIGGICILALLALALTSDFFFLFN